MDKLVYLASQAAKGTMARQENIANNLANVNTPGFRQQLMAFQSAPVVGEGSGSRSFAVETSVGFDTTPGQIQSTGRDMDVAIQGKGWFAVTAANGNEAYTRNGSFQVDSGGNLVTQEGYPVIGTSGPINVPPDHRLSFETDGTVSAIPLTGQGGVVPLGQLKLVDVEEGQLARGDDGLFRRKDGQDADPDPTVRVAGGFIETSNVNAVDMMVQMITAARQYETQMKMISSAQENDRAANNLFGLN
ncbi:MAG TPA: flagellar basal-body rod protein FlgF [Limnobacter sp.]|uniref:flagellar basal-body rod protein FlgF n=1 Tax=Limnobacter sp. TaxID=2003368 RepID=UPI002EDB2709